MPRRTCSPFALIPAHMTQPSLRPSWSSPRSSTCAVLPAQSSASDCRERAPKRCAFSGASMSASRMTCSCLSASRIVRLAPSATSTTRPSSSPALADSACADKRAHATIATVKLRMVTVTAALGAWTRGRQDHRASFDLAYVAARRDLPFVASCLEYRKALPAARTRRLRKRRPARAPQALPAIVRNPGKRAPGAFRHIHSRRSPLPR